MQPGVCFARCTLHNQALVEGGGGRFDGGGGCVYMHWFVWAATRPPIRTCSRQTGQVDGSERADNPVGNDSWFFGGNAGGRSLIERDSRISHALFLIGRMWSPYGIATRDTSYIHTRPFS